MTGCFLLLVTEESRHGAAKMVKTEIMYTHIVSYIFGGTVGLSKCCFPVLLLQIHMLNRLNY